VGANNVSAGFVTRPSADAPKNAHVRAPVVKRRVKQIDRRIRSRRFHRQLSVVALSGEAAIQDPRRYRVR
jgi:hypothetical protein